MTKQIIIAADESIVCPDCGHHFPLDKGITGQTIERYEDELNHKLVSLKKELEEKLAREAERKAEKKFIEQISQLNEKVLDGKKVAEDAKLQIEKIKLDVQSKAKLEFDLERKTYEQNLLDKETKLCEFREQELALRRQKTALEEAHRNLEIDTQRKIDEERTKIKEQIGAAEAERFRFKEAELLKKISDAQRSNDELSRKLEQGSQQLQGEVLELELEHMLADAFRHDRIEEVKKGVRGADVIQTVCTPAGLDCGRIIWETKRAENWSDKWLQKLKDDQQEAKADIAVLVTTVMPKGVQEAFCRVGDVWVVSPHVMRPVAETLRVLMLESSRLKLVSSGRNEKMELLYNYLASAQFAHKVRTMLESLECMRTDLEAEKRAMQKIWVKRQTQIERSTYSMVSVVGELQAIAQDGLPQLEALEILSLPDSNEVDL